MNYNVAILIPAYNPNEKLILLVEQLIKCNFNHSKIVIVDDGSINKNIFSTLKNTGVQILHHKENKGKGAALKTGFNYCIQNYCDISGIVTADCDGQHCCRDILSIVSQLSKNSNCLHLGCRNFYQDEVPIKSIIGNIAMNFILKFLYHIDVQDSQTGLRGLPINFAAKCIKLNGKSFDYETNMLLLAKAENLKIAEHKISTKYFDKNKLSHFNSIKDSFLICKTLLCNNIKSI